jgi:hypothetical protein
MAIKKRYPGATTASLDAAEAIKKIPVVGNTFNVNNTEKSQAATASRTATNQQKTTQTSAPSQTKQTDQKPSWMSDSSYAGVTEQWNPKSDPTIIAAEQTINEAMEWIKNPSNLDRLNSIWDEYTGREKFSYDYAADPMFQNMMAGMKTQGQLAMENAMAEAAGLTGGYASSWSQSAGQQAYNQLLQKGYDNLPAYYQMALDAYNQEGDSILQKYNLASDLYNKEYSAMLDQLEHGKYLYENAYKDYGNAFEERKSTASYLAGIEKDQYEADQAKAEAQKEREHELIMNGYVYNSSTGQWIAPSGENYDDQVKELSSALKQAEERGNLTEFVEKNGLVGTDLLNDAMYSAGMTSTGGDLDDAYAALSRAATLAQKAEKGLSWMSMEEQLELEELYSKYGSYWDETTSDRIRKALNYR